MSRHARELRMQPAHAQLGCGDRREPGSDDRLTTSHLAGNRERPERNASHKPRPARITESQPVVLRMNNVHTKKKPPDLLTTVPGEWTTIIAAAIRPPNNMIK